MDSQIYKRFADTIIELAPDLSMSAEEIQTLLKSDGLEQFSQAAGAQINEFVEATEIIARMETRGDLSV